MMTSLYQSVGVVDAVEWACVLCGCCIQNGWLEQYICIQFCIKFEYSSTETIQMIQKAAAIDNWWLAASSQQCAYSRIHLVQRFFLQNIKSPRGLATPELRFGALQLLAFPKLNPSLKGKRFQTIDEIQENPMGQLMAMGRTVWSPMVPTLKGLRCLVLKTMFLVSYIFFNKCLYFS